MQPRAKTSKTGVWHRLASTVIDEYTLAHSPRQLGNDVHKVMLRASSTGRRFRPHIALCTRRHCSAWGISSSTTAVPGCSSLAAKVAVDPVGLARADEPRCRVVVDKLPLFAIKSSLNRICPTCRFAPPPSSGEAEP